MKLTPEQEQWLTALESGEYKQGEQELRSKDDCFCCLGVACELFIPNTRKTTTRGRTMEGEPNVVNFYGEEENAASAPREIKKLLHLQNRYGATKGKHVLAGSVHDSLVSMNDNGATFKEIAAFIRANPEKVFVRGEE